MSLSLTKQIVGHVDLARSCTNWSAGPFLGAGRDQPLGTIAANEAIGVRAEGLGLLGFKLDPPASSSKVVRAPQSIAYGMRASLLL